MERGDIVRTAAEQTSPEEFVRRFSDLLLLRQLTETERSDFGGGTSTGVKAYVSAEFPAVTMEAARAEAHSLLPELEADPARYVLHPLRGRGGASSAGLLRVGRSDANDIRIDDPSVSKLHACLRRDPSGRWTVLDMRSRNGTIRDGVNVPTQEPGLFVRVGTMVTFGDVTCEIVSGLTLFRAPT